MKINIVDIISIFSVLFAVIDIIGSIPVIIDLKRKTGNINPLKISIISLLVLVIFLFVGEGILSLFSVDILSFALAGSFVIFLLAMEMVLNIEIFKSQNIGGDSVVPLVFPLIAGAGSLTTLLSLRSQYNEINIIIGIFLNIVVVYIVLRLTNSIEKLLGQSGIYILRKIFGIILLAVAIKLFLSSTGLDLAK